MPDFSELTDIRTQVVKLHKQHGSGTPARCLAKVRSLQQLVTQILLRYRHALRLPNIPNELLRAATGEPGRNPPDQRAIDSIYFAISHSLKQRGSLPRRLFDAALEQTQTTRASAWREQAQDLLNVIDWATAVWESRRPPDFSAISDRILLMLKHPAARPDDAAQEELIALQAQIGRVFREHLLRRHPGLPDIDVSDATGLTLSDRPSASRDALNRAIYGWVERELERSGQIPSVTELVSAGDQPVAATRPKRLHWTTTASNMLEVCRDLERKVANSPQHPTPSNESPRRPWEPPPGFVSTKSIGLDPRFQKHGKNPPRTTIDAWLIAARGQKMDVETHKAPDSGLLYLPEKWVLDRIREWHPRMNRKGT